MPKLSRKQSAPTPAGTGVAKILKALISQNTPCSASRSLRTIAPARRGWLINSYKDTATKKYLFDISYHTPAAVCRRLGYWDVWVVVPKIPDDYESSFQVRKIPLNGTEQ
ncbi:MAG TPA: hypothetical protein VIQ24_16800 [Pyrinomonadaceae bacterium]